MSRADSPTGNDSGLASSSQASPTSTASTTPLTQQTSAVQAKRSSFSISNLLATEEEKSGRASPPIIKGGLLVSRAEEALSAEEVGAMHKSPFLNASALAHLAHLHGNAGSTPPWDWLSSGLHPDSSALWSRFEPTLTIHKL